MRKLRATIVRVLELVPVSPLGLLLAAAAYGVLTRFARVEQDLVWLVLSYGALALCAIGPVAVLLGALSVKLQLARRHAQPAAARLRLETGVAADTGFTLRRPWYVPFVQLGWRWAEPEGAVVEPQPDAGVLRERVAPSARGRFERIERRVTVSDVFGLSRVVLRPGEACAVDVLPRLSALRHLPELQSFASGDARPHPLGLAEGDRLELRRYQSGDPARYIHWKVLARTRKLMVRVPERALSIAHRTAAFLVAGPADDASAACARLALERGLLGSDWIFGTDLAPEGSQRLDVALSALMHSARVGDAGGSALAGFAQSAARTGPVSLIVFAPAAPGPWLSRVAAVARQHRPQVVIGVDGVAPRAPRTRWSRLLAFAEPRASSVAEELDEVARVLSAAGAHVTVLDRGSGRVLSSAHRAGMRALEARAA